MCLELKPTVAMRSMRQPTTPALDVVAFLPRPNFRSHSSPSPVRDVLLLPEEDEQVAQVSEGRVGRSCRGGSSSHHPSVSCRVVMLKQNGDRSTAVQRVCSVAAQRARGQDKTRTATSAVRSRRTDRKGGHGVKGLAGGAMDGRQCCHADGLRLSCLPMCRDATQRSSC